MTTKEITKNNDTPKAYPEVARRYLRKHYDKVLEIQRRYRANNREVVREWHREAQRRFYLKNKNKPEYQATKYYSNQKSAFKRYVLDHAELEELNLFLSVLEAKKKNEAVRRPALIKLDDKKVQKLRTIAYRFIFMNIEPIDYKFADEIIKEAIEKHE